MNKGIAIQTILLLLVGVIVAAILIYLIYSYATTPTLSITECQSRIISWCTQCKTRAAGGNWPTNMYITSALYTECSTVMSNAGYPSFTMSTSCYAAHVIGTSPGICTALGIT